MLSIVRERIMEQLLIIPGLVDQYANQDTQFMPNVARWLRASEQALEPFRLPLVSRLATLRGELLAIAEGVTESGSKISRKQKRGEAVRVLQQSEEALRLHLSTLDTQFDEFREKLSQLLAVASSRSPLPATEHVTAEYLDRLWSRARSEPDNATLALYLQGRLSETDRRYLLSDVVERLLNAGPA